MWLVGAPFPGPSQFCALHTQTEEISASMSFFVDGLHTPIFFYSRGCQPFGKPRKSRKVKHTGKPLFFLHTFARKKPRFQVPVSKEKKLCRFALVQKKPSSSQLGMELRSQDILEKPVLTLFRSLGFVS